MAYNLRQKGDHTTLDDSKLRQVNDFKYLGSWIDQTKKYVEFCEAKAWAAGNKLTVVWRSNRRRDLRTRFFRASVESGPLYRSESWTLTKALEKQLLAVAQGC